ncbi:hypothetical protein NA57DRAFT_76089 [Rhizodiscina lignyota]|uniref:Heterokaryon incompatibility domain-containing protein n=1 Tax=Rhizodiscina lignyota TaxID=1504668 RepID=A0A9P4II33_9PEZI|nr:hypothetical protein NA57DRAFT_76089 [Rhizodiscina lignyota]
MAPLVFLGNAELGIPALYLHDLTGTPNAERLLNISPTIHPESANVLPRLKQFAPTEYELFSEKNADKKSIPFKLITTSPTWNEARTTSFLAVSYCWHANDWTVVSRLFESVDPARWELPLSPPMISAILSLATCDDEGIWIDQICVNQSNEDEKKNAIENMDTIFRNARVVGISIEDVNISETQECALEIFSVTQESALETIFSHNLDEERRNKEEIQKAPKPITLGLVEDVVAAGQLERRHIGGLVSYINSFFCARWFSRAWCVHEYQLNSQRKFIIPGHDHKYITFDYSFFGDLYSEVENLFPRSLSDELCNHSGFLSFLWGPRLRTPDDSYTSSSIFEMCYLVENARCSRLEDKISIACNINGLPLRFNGSVSGRWECMKLLALLALSAGDASVLGCEGEPCECSKFSGHFSWLQWPGFRPGKGNDLRLVAENYAWTTLCSRYMQKMNAEHQIKSINEQSIMMDLLQFHGNLKEPTTTGYFRAANFIQRFGKLEQHLKSSDDDNHLKLAFQFGLHNIAHIVDFGYTWFLKSFRTMSRSFLDRVENIYERHSPLLEDVFNEGSDSFEMLFRANNGRPRQLSGEAPEQIAMYLSFMLLGLEAGDFIDNDDTDTMVVRGIRLGADHEFGIVYLDREYLARYSQGDDMILAIPAALNTPDAIGVKRVWVLQRLDGRSKSCSLIGKGYLIGSNAVPIDGDYVTYMTDVEIMGPRKEESSKESTSNKIMDMMDTS